MNSNQINQILSDLESGYDQMADKFSGTRKFFWRDLEFISQYVSDGDSILDYGCGNGRLLEILGDKKINYTGADISQELLNLARIKYPERQFVKLSGQAILPFPDNFFNEVISVAVFHHFPSFYAQEMAKELYRTTKPGGRIIITAWNLWQRRFWGQIFNPKRIFKNNGNIKDIFIPFKDNQGKLFDRYHHAYTKRELRNIFLDVGFEVKRCFMMSKKNIIIVANKKVNTVDI
jgi:alkylated DNA repair protein alkB family protein 8